MAKTGFSLKRVLKTKLVNEILGSNQSQDPYQVLVLDAHTSKIVSSCSTMSDLLDKGFVALQNIDMNRQAIDLPATYFLTVSGNDDEKNREDMMKLTNLIKDFSEGPEWNPDTKSGKRLKKKYLRAYVYVTQTLKKAMISSVLAKERRFVKSCRALSEINIDFLSYESRVFLLNQPFVLDTLMKKGDGSLADSMRIVERVTKQLVSLCIAMNEKPYVRFEKSVSGGNIERLVEVLASSSTFETALREATTKLPNWKSRANPATLLFLNRVTDMASTLIHHISYQSVLLNVLGMEGDVLKMEVDKKNPQTGTVEGKEVKAYVMSEDDDIWREKRHKHFDTFKNELYDEVQAFKKKSVSNKVRTEGFEMDHKTMLKVVKDLPKYREMARVFKKHQNILNIAGEEIKKKVPAITLLQDLACGFDNGGSSLKPQSCWEQVQMLLKDNTTAHLDKASIAILYVIMRGGMTSSEKEFFESSLDRGTMAAINNLSLAGFNTSKPKAGQSWDKQHVEMMKTRLKNLLSEKKSGKRAYTIGNRFLSKVHYVCSQLVEEKLDKKAYPYTNAPPKSAQRSAARTTGFSVRRNRKRQTDNGDSDKPRIIIFVFGGITPAEMASAYEIGDQWNVEIIIGSTDIITSEEVVKSLSQGAIAKEKDLNPSAQRDLINV